MSPIRRCCCRSPAPASLESVCVSTLDAGADARTTHVTLVRLRRSSDVSLQLCDGVVTENRVSRVDFTLRQSWRRRPDQRRAGAVTTTLRRASCHCTNDLNTVSSNDARPVRRVTQTVLIQSRPVFP